MKTLFLFTLTVVLSLNLSARENPFEIANNLFEEETGKILETNESPMTPEAIQEAEFIKRAQQEMSNGANKNKVTDAVNKIVPAISDKPTPKSYSKQEVDSLIQKTKSQTEQKTKEIVKKELAKTKSEGDQVVFVKPRSDVEEDMLSKKILPFLSFEYSNNKLIINTEYKVSKKFSIDKENKLIIDYKAKENFTTKSAELNTTNFKRVVVGNHSGENFFRIAVELNDKPSKYSVDYKENSIIISKTN